MDNQRKKVNRHLNYSTIVITSDRCFHDNSMIAREDLHRRCNGLLRRKRKVEEEPQYCRLCLVYSRGRSCQVPYQYPAHHVDMNSPGTHHLSASQSARSLVSSRENLSEVLCLLVLTSQPGSWSRAIKTHDLSFTSSATLFWHAPQRIQGSKYGRKQC